MPNAHNTLTLSVLYVILSPLFAISYSQQGEYKASSLAPSHASFLLTSLLTYRRAYLGGPLADCLPRIAHVRGQGDARPHGKNGRLTKIGSHAVLLAGNGIAVCASSVRRVNASNSARFSINHLATPASSRCASASSNSSFDRFSACAERSRAASSNSRIVRSEDSSKNSKGGNDGRFNLASGQQQYQFAS